ncbi:MAG: alcohol dehydrogenase [Acidobacteria bacterium RIFCSPLOWO2_12_FULL_59_11]|nr:MAG: alcohol dehydrogenase [Acidobacteria bacterium RIFCSPLOWO2_12_FULL_59_11]
MKAIRIHAHGGVEQLRIDVVETPQPVPRQVLVEVKAAGLNHLDIFVRKGFPGLHVPMTLGSDASGVVKEIGSAVSQFAVGDRVLVQPGYGCGLCELCLSGKENYCAKYGIVGEHRDGVQAQFLALDEDKVIRMPSNIGFEEGAAIPLVYITAWEMLVSKAGIKPADMVLVVAASSGVGSAAVQIAKVCGARVIATAGTAAKLEKARALGADFVLDHYQQDVAKEVKKITSGRGVDIVIEHVGAATWQASLRSLAKGGKLVVCGSTAGYEVNVDLRFLYFRQQSILGSTMGTRGDLFKILQFVEAGKLRGVVDKVFPFAEVAKAHEYLEGGKQFGKVILSFAS